MTKGKAETATDDDALRQELVSAEGYHRLFPQPLTGGDGWKPTPPSWIAEIRLYVVEPGGGEAHLGNYGPGDLQNEESIRGIWGAGRYNAVAMDRRAGHQGQVITRRYVNLSATKPQGPSGVVAPADGPPLVAPPAGAPWWAGLLVAAVPVVTQALTSKAQRDDAVADAARAQAAAAQAQVNQMMMAMMSGQTELVKAAMTNRGGSGVDPVESAGRILELAARAAPKPSAAAEKPDVFDKALESLLPGLLARIAGGGGLPPGLLGPNMPPGLA